ncbi:MAG: aminotransferase class I/II-fold pyridoxal phosphate-dependent enzyme [Planctomycetota bacterium]|jgi:DNA-binding transcriptional MocR family regulator
MKTLLQKYIKGGSAVNIIDGLESAIRAGDLSPGSRVPTIRGMAEALGVSPATVSSAYKSLHARGILVSKGRAGTKVSHRPLHGPMCQRPVPAGVRALCSGNPDPALLPPTKAAMNETEYQPILYGCSTQDSDLIVTVSRDLAADGVTVGETCVVSGAMDAMERVLVEHVRPGDRVAVEDPGFGSVFSLVMSMGMSLVPVGLDDAGILPDELEQACREGVKALIVTPRAQTPTGAILTEGRARELRSVLSRYPDMVIIEDDHANLVSDAPLNCLHTGSRNAWAHVRSFAKPLNPDLRVAVMTGDALTMSRVQDRMILGCRWVSHLLQRVAYVLLSDNEVRVKLGQAARLYSERRAALVDALKRRGLAAHARSGFNVWIPVPEETPVVRGLIERGWSVAAGERFRITSPPAIRVTTATLDPAEAEYFADHLHATMYGSYRRAMV